MPENVISQIIALFGRSGPDRSTPNVNEHILHVAKSGSGAVGRLQIISIEKIRPYVPPQEWTGFAAKLRTTMTSVIMKRLGPGDSFTQTGDDSFIIVFSGLKCEDAELECVLIIQEVMRAMFSDRKMDDSVDIRSVAIGLDGSLDVRQVDLLGVIDRLLAAEQETRLAQRRRAVNHAFAPVIDVPDDAERFDRIMEGLPEREMLMEFRPLWDVKRKILSAYVCVLPGAENLLSAEPDTRRRAYRQAALDFLAIGRVTHELRRLNSINRRLLMHCPVHINTLCDAGTWATYRILCERLSHTPMRRELVFELSGIDSDTAREHIALSASRLVAHCRAIVGRTMPGDIGLEKFEGTPLAFLSMSAGTHAGEKRSMKLMDEYVECAQKLGFGAIATGLDSLSLAVAAVGSGFDMIGGDAIHPPIQRPEFVYRFEARNLLGKLAS
jgi:hypothetical protein